MAGQTTCLRECPLRNCRILEVRRFRKAGLLLRGCFTLPEGTSPIVPVHVPSVIRPIGYNCPAPKDACQDWCLVGRARLLPSRLRHAVGKRLGYTVREEGLARLTRQPILPRECGTCEVDTALDSGSWQDRRWNAQRNTDGALHLVRRLPCSVTRICRPRTPHGVFLRAGRRDDGDRTSGWNAYFARAVPLR
jgi:hypothetical protein